MNFERHYLTPLFEPKSIAIIGASEKPGSIGATLVRNMLGSGYGGALHFVNPRHRTIFGKPVWPEVAAIPERLDLVVVCTRAPTVPGIIEQCGRAGARCAIIVSAGFSEAGPEGAALEARVLEAARRHRLRVLGPNCLGVMRPGNGINLTFANDVANPGTIGMVSQSGALCTALLDWALPNNVGFSSVVTLGITSDVDFGEVLDYLTCDVRTEHIFLYIEGVKNARRFMSALRAAARAKPVLAIKVGRHPAGEQAALSHTGSVVGADDVFDAAVRRVGVIRLSTVGQMYAAAQALFSHFRPHGNRLAIVTNGGGPGVMAADRADALRIPLAELAPETIAALREALPANHLAMNPLDIGGDTGPERYGAALAACLADERVDGVLAIFSPQALTDPTQTARVVIELAQRSAKPLVACWMGETQVREARLLFKGAGVPQLNTPEPAVDLFSHIANYYRNQQLLLQTPASLSAAVPPHLESARLVMETALAEGRRALSEIESKALLAAFHIPIAQTMVARSESEAMVLATEIGPPVVMKIDSPQVLHKSDCGGVRLNVDIATVPETYRSIIAEVKKAHPDALINGIAIEPMIVKKNGRELMVGIAQDQVFGPVVTLGPGGTGVEAGKERAVGLPPLNGFLVADMIESTRSIAQLDGLRNMPAVSREAIEAVLLRVSEMVCELPWLRTMEINPLIVDEHGAVAVDACIAIEKPPAGTGRYDHMAIHPYPSHQTERYRARDGRMVTIRPIRPEDTKLETDFLARLSPQTRYFRFMNTVRELPQAQLIRLTQPDYDREMAFVATVNNAAGAEEEVGVVRYATNPDGESCEFAIVVADDWAGSGLAQHLMRVLIDTARAAGLKYMSGDFLAENRRMIRFVTRLGFTVASHPDDASLKRGVLQLK